MQVTFEFEEMYVVELFSIYIFRKNRTLLHLEKRGSESSGFPQSRVPLYIKDTVMIGMARKY